MTIDEVKKALENHLYSQLVFNSPILSGNMMMNISQGSSEIIIAAPFYDSKMWRKKHPQNFPQKSGKILWKSKRSIKYI